MSPLRCTVATLIFSTVAAMVLPMLSSAIQPVIPVQQIQPLTGKAFIGKLTDPELSDHERPTNARLYLVQSRRGTALHHFDATCYPSYACAWLNALLDANYPLSTYEVRTQLGPGGALHQDIPTMAPATTRSGAVTSISASRPDRPSSMQGDLRSNHIRAGGPLYSS